MEMEFEPVIGPAQKVLSEVIVRYQQKLRTEELTELLLAIRAFGEERFTQGGTLAADVGFRAALEWGRKSGCFQCHRHLRAWEEGRTDLRPDPEAP